MVRASYAPSPAKIKVVGLGGAGGNAITRMIREQIRGVEFIAMDTDIWHLATSEAALKVRLGKRNTYGLGVGGDYLLGRKAAEESRDEIREAIRGADMVFVTAGMGGGTGTGAAPLVAEIAKQSGALTIAIVTKPFSFEGTHRNQIAKDGITKLIDNVDSLVIISNDRLLQLYGQETGVDVAFKMADEVLFNGVQAIAEVITVPGLVNLDFAGVRTVLKDAGLAWISVGRGSGPERAVDAAKKALTSPLMDISFEGAEKVLFNIVGGSNLTLFEVKNASGLIHQAVDPEANIIFGIVLDLNMGNDMRLTLIATGFPSKGTLRDNTYGEEITRLLKDL